MAAVLYSHPVKKQGRTL